MARFRNDLFISYSHIDNQPLRPEDKGWISRFHASLEALLSMRMGQAAKIWRDDKLQGNDIFSDEIIQQFAQTAVFLSILTPRYLKSEWCTREVREFCEQAKQSGGVVIDNKARVFKIMKTPVDAQEFLPPAIKDILGYEFFSLEDGTPLELDPAYGDKFAQDFNRKVGKLAWDISQLLKQLAADAEVSGKDAATPTALKPTVYLAECSYDRKGIREILEGDLRCHGYTVLPDQQLPRDEAGYVAAVEVLLARSKFSIHLIGESYGAVPDGLSQKSVIVLQNEVAVNKSKNSVFPRIIWLSEGTSSTQLAQHLFIEALHQDAEVQFGADLITGDLEALKASIHATLKKLEQPEPVLHEAQADSANATNLGPVNTT
ncbi:MAG: toll/interleukin-1 receptor domain-containing protein [Gammaproteobacteria bacterium]|nr:MAG: toll/interleukin-1 receptor domain-containing protein [Gammaproteobacteria bacterium]